MRIEGAIPRQSRSEAHLRHTCDALHANTPKKKKPLDTRLCHRPPVTHSVGVRCLAPFRVASINACDVRSNSWSARRNHQHRRRTTKPALNVAAVCWIVRSSLGDTTVKSSVVGAGGPGQSQHAYSIRSKTRSRIRTKIRTAMQQLDHLSSTLSAKQSRIDSGTTYPRSF